MAPARQHSMTSPNPALDRLARGTVSHGCKSGRLGALLAIGQCVTTWSFQETSCPSAFRTPPF